jgi:TIR domain
MTNGETRSPIVFISYSHDSPEHADRVLALSDHLRADGIDCILDQYIDSPPEGWPRWMDRQIHAADFVLMICTSTYYRRVMGKEEPGTGTGVLWESTLIYQYIYNTGTLNTQFIPILFEGANIADIPTPLQSATYYHSSGDAGYEELYRRLTHQPKTLKPALGMLRALPPRERTQDFVKNVPDDTRQEYATSENSESQSSVSQIPLPPITEANISNLTENAEFQESEPGTIPTSTNEVGSTQGEIQIQGSTEELLTQEEREKLIALLCELPNIGYANVRHSLVSTLPAEFQNNIDFDMPLGDHITEIVDTVISDPHFQLPDGSYPIMVLIENALDVVKKSQLRDELQLLLNNLEDRHGVVPQLHAVPTSLDRFIQYLENFILQMPAVEYELKSITKSFNYYMLQPVCKSLANRLVKVSAPFLELATLLDQSNIPKVKSFRVSLVFVLHDFNRQAENVEKTVNEFCTTYGTVLEKDQPVAERRAIQYKLDALRVFITSVLEKAKHLINELRKHA